MIKQGDTVTVHYTGKFSDGEIFDTSLGKEPLVFTAGSEEVIKGFDTAVIGKIAGDKISVVIPASEGYGEIHSDLIIDVPKDNVPQEAIPGSKLYSVTPQGTPYLVIVKEIKDDVVVVDANHELAGKELHFDIEVVSVQEN
jgi:peptidylprolyl isomerase